MGGVALQIPLPAWMTDEDRVLLERARAWIEARASSELTPEDIESITRAHGVDFATAILWQHLRDRPENRELIHGIELGKMPAAIAKPPRILIVPGAFHAEYHHTGADGKRVLELASQLGWEAERIDVPSLAPMEQNAAALVDYLARHPRKPTILVSLSKGGADVRVAMERPQAADEMRDVIAWVNFSGMAYGTPLVQWLKARPLRCCWVRLLLRLRRQRFAEIQELCTSGRLRQVFTPPARVRALHILGFPLKPHLSNTWARRGHKRLSFLGPNDGGGNLLAHALRLPGSVYPMWGADHYMQPPWDVRPLLRNILIAAASLGLSR